MLAGSLYAPRAVRGISARTVVPNPTGPDTVRMLTADGVSPSVGSATVWTSLITFTLLYAALAVIELRLMLRYVKAGPQPEPVTSTDDVEGERPLAFAY